MMLYRFDKKLRLLLFNEIEKVEVAIRSVIFIKCKKRQFTAIKSVNCRFAIFYSDTTFGKDLSYMFRGKCLVCP